LRLCPSVPGDFETKSDVALAIQVAQVPADLPKAKSDLELEGKKWSVSFCVPLALPVLNRLSTSRNEHWQSQWHPKADLPELEFGEFSN